ncbi:MAG: hypothetical protein V7K68_05145 [Nostoc sp.]|uniref:hypothetical protein n=1 Tax=Nostoc sp. TaxID=1180 RepID=UPI002FF46D59
MRETLKREGGSCYSQGRLEMAGYDVSQAEDGIKGQALALQLQPDLIMLDLMLPRQH